jgi:DinB superfamily
VCVYITDAVRWVVALQADSRSPAWSVRLTDELDTTDRQANDLARGLSPEQLNWKPAEDLWSVGQCLQHLYAANEVYLPAIANALDDRPPSPVQDITPGWFGRWFIRTYIEPSSRSKRTRAPRKIAPARQIDPSVLDLFLRSNDVARDLVRRAGAYDINRIRFRNPFIPLLRFTVGTGLEILWRHQRRHLLQAERIEQAPTFPRQ